MSDIFELLDKADQASGEVRAAMYEIQQIIKKDRKEALSLKNKIRESNITLEGKKFLCRDCGNEYSREDLNINELCVACVGENDSN